MVPTHWSRFKSGSAIASESSTNWLESYIIPNNFNPGEEWELRDSVTLYQQYETVPVVPPNTPPDRTPITTSVSLLVNETKNVSDRFTSNQVSDKGRHYKSDNEKVATVTQDGTIRGVARGETTIHVYVSDGKNEMGTCTVTVSESSVTIPSVLPLGSYAEVGVTASAGGNDSVKATLTMESLSGLQGSSPGATYRLNAFKRNKTGDQYTAVSEGSVIAEATANKANKTISKKVQFKVDPDVAYEELLPGLYSAEIVWRLNLKLN